MVEVPHTPVHSVDFEALVDHQQGLVLADGLFDRVEFVHVYIEAGQDAGVVKQESGRIGGLLKRPLSMMQCSHLTDVRRQILDLLWSGKQIDRVETWRVVEQSFGLPRPLGVQ